MKEISADKKLSIKDLLWYLVYNFFRGVWGFRTFLKSTYWHTSHIGNGSDSPGRKYLDAFFEKKLPELLPRKDISVLDIGCGSGYIRKILHDLGYRVTYTGVDTVLEDDFDSYTRYADESKFIKKPIEKFETEEKFDLVFSLCALEHIEND